MNRRLTQTTTTTPPGRAQLLLSRLLLGRSPALACGSVGASPSRSRSAFTLIELPVVRQSKSTAFTLIELLVVMSIIAIMGAITIPAMTYLTKSGKVEAGMNAISVAAASTRAYAGRDLQHKFRDVDNDDANGEQEGTYSGVAMIFTPANEIRIVENVAEAKDGSGNYLELNASPSRSGYADLEGRDYISIPSGSGVLGIVRNGPNDDDIKLLAPPFAVRFNEHGQLIARISAADGGLVYYDGNYNGEYVISATRNSVQFDPREFDPDSPDFEPNNWDTNVQKYVLPIEAIETVIAVLVYSKTDLRDAGFTMGPNSYEIDDFASDTKGRWLLDNGQPIYFNRYSGLVVRDR